jgi:hypothetical protein
VSRTAGKSLEGRAFLHTYDWKKDAENGFGVLELIMTAPVVVASWISLQYYGSSVAPQAFGGGNKLIHNVVGGIGVVEGNGGSRPGLPWQSVHDGEKLAHEPLRLSVMIEAPRSQMARKIVMPSSVIHGVPPPAGWCKINPKMGLIPRRQRGGIFGSKEDPANSCDLLHPAILSNSERLARQLCIVSPATKPSTPTRIRLSAQTMSRLNQLREMN